MEESSIEKIRNSYKTYNNLQQIELYKEHGKT